MRRSLVGIIALVWVAASVAHAADRAVTLKKMLPVRRGVSAMPEIANPQDDAERAINLALAKLDATVRAALKTCKTDENKPGNWDRTVQVAMAGPGYLSFVITDNTDCGGAYPNLNVMSIVYDLRTGRPVDWTKLLPPSLVGQVSLEEGTDGTKMVTLASKRLFALYLAGYPADSDQNCKDAVHDAADSGPPAMMVWLDAKQGGLAVRFDLAHVVQVCATPVVIPAATLRSEGTNPQLVDAIDAAHLGSAGK